MNFPNNFYQIAGKFTSDKTRWRVSRLYWAGEKGLQWFSKVHCKIDEGIHDLIMWYIQINECATIGGYNISIG